MDTTALRAALAASLPADWRRGMDARVLVALVAVDAWGQWADAASECLDADERARVDRRRFVEHRRVLALAYALHRLFLAEWMGCGPGAVPLRRDARGCPRVDVPAVRTSLSHVDGAIAMAVAHGGPVGVDIEAVSRDMAMDEIAGRIWHPHEAAMLATLPGPARRRELLALWVRKEAVLKAAGIGLALEMNAFAAPVDGLVALPSSQAEPIRVRQFDAGPCWAVAVATSPLASVDCRWLRPPD